MTHGNSAGRGGAIAASHRSKPLPVLRFTKLDKVFTYGIVATRGWQRTVVATDDRLRGSSG
jgi:hypothetical protein